MSRPEHRKKTARRPLPLRPEQELALRFRVAFMTADVARAKRAAVEVRMEPHANRKPAERAAEGALAPAALRVWWQGLDHTTRQQLTPPLSHLAGIDFLSAARAAWKQARALARKRSASSGADPASVFTGTIRLWQEDKGFGFIARPGAPDVFCHVTKLLDRDSVPRIGQRVRYQLEPSRNKPGTMAAARVEIADKDNMPAADKGAPPPHPVPQT